MLNRKEPPHLSFDPTIDDLAYETNSLTNGISLYSIIDKKQDVCGIEIIFGGGKIEESINGASYFATNLLKAGSTKNNATAINNFFEIRGAFVQFQNGLDHNSFSLYCLTSKLKESLPFFVELFNDPTFPSTKLKQLKSKKQQQLKVNKQKSSYWSTKLLKQALFKEHPYGQTLNEEDIKSISSQDLKNHWDGHSLKNIQFVTAAGNFDKKMVVTALESSLEKNNKLYERAKEIILISQQSESLSKSLKDSQQSSLKIGFHTINFLRPQYPTLSLGNAILGGYFGSRLMQSIREDKGLTYGIGSSIQHLKLSSFIQISADIKMDAGKKVIELIKLELDKLITKSIPEAELIKVKHYLIGEYKSNNQTIFDKINKIKFLKINNLSDSYFKLHFNSILNQHSQDIQEVLAVHYESNNFNTVLVE